MITSDRDLTLSVGSLALDLPALLNAQLSFPMLRCTDGQKDGTRMILRIAYLRAEEDIQ